MEIALVSAGATIIAALLGYIFLMQKNKAEVTKISSESEKSKEETTALKQDTTTKRIAWLEKYASTLEEKLELKDVIIGGLNKRIEEKEIVEKTYIHEINALKEKIDELANKVSELSNRMPTHPTKTISKPIKKS